MQSFSSCSKSNSISPNHRENQDSLLADQKNLLFAVADGVGGYLGAKEASSTAVDILSENASKICDEKSLEIVTKEIHNAIVKKSRKLNYPNMGTTLAVVKLDPVDGKVIIGNVGDSPVLLFRNGSMEPLYEDDSYRSRDPMSMYSIIQYLGLNQELDIHIRTIPWIPGGTILLCSDGITDNFLNSAGGASELATKVKLGAERIVQGAIEKEVKHDDMTAVVVELDV